MDYGPSSPLYVGDLAKLLLEPIKRGESAFLRWFPGHGKTALLGHIFSDKNLLQKHLGEFYRRFVFVKLEGYLFSVADVPNFFNYVLHTLLETLDDKKVSGLKAPSRVQTVQSSQILTLKQMIDLCRGVVSLGRELVFIIDGIDEFSNDKLKDIFIAWEYVVESNRERIHTLFNVNRRDIIEEIVTQSGLLQNIVQIGLPNKTECEYFIDYYLKKWRMKLAPATRENILKICGHDPVLLKEALRIFHKKPDFNIDLLSEPTLLIKAKNDYQLLSRSEKAVVESKVKTNTLPPHLKSEAKRLVSANLLDKDSQLSLLFERVVIQQGESARDLFIDQKKKTLHFGDIDLSKKMSDTEHKILYLLYQKRGQLTSRDEVAECIWGKQMLDAYSDWAIDKAISRLRMKLARLSIFYQIYTKKKEGFYLDI